MAFRQGGHRDKRWRRMLTGESTVSAPAGCASETSRSAETAASPGHLARRYTDAALSPCQPRVIDLIPTRRWTNLILFMLALACVAGIEALYGYLALGYARLDVSLFPAIDLAERGTVATWFSSAALAGCGVFGLLIYRIRRHRTDDYRGRYRMWSWFVPVFVFASIDQVAGIQDSVRTFVIYSAGGADMADPVLVWTASMALLTTVAGLRLFMEIRACRVASLLLVTTLVGFTTVDAIRVGWLFVDASIFRIMAVSTLTMVSHVFLLMTILLYARHVHRDASGQVPVKRLRKRNVKKRAQRQDTDDELLRDASSSDGVRQSADASQQRKTSRRKSGRITRTDPPHLESDKPDTVKDSSKRTAATERSSRTSGRPQGKEKRRVAASASAVKTASAPVALCAPDDDQVVDPHKLSKAERKRLRKQRRKERQS